MTVCAWHVKAVQALSDIFFIFNCCDAVKCYIQCAAQIFRSSWRTRHGMDMAESNYNEKNSPIYVRKAKLKNTPQKYRASVTDTKK